MTTGIRPGEQAPAAGTLTLGPLATDSGAIVDGLSVRYRVFGDPAQAAVNGWILVFHALTGSADVDAWWGDILGPARALDTGRHAVVALNLPGSCYGSTGPREWQAAGRGSFPALTTRDLAHVHEQLLDHLGIREVALATGGSLGGMIALQWGAITSRRVRRLAVLAAPAVTSPQSIAWNVAQRMAIEADSRWRGGVYPADDQPATGLAAARAIAMITYRSGLEFETRFGRARSRQGDRLAVEAYLRRHGEKLIARFDARSYVTLTEVMDRHDVGSIAGAAEATARRVDEVIGVGVDTDILYLPGEVRAWVDAYREHGANASYREITSICGHDAFLIELDQVSRILAPETMAGTA